MGLFEDLLGIGQSALGMDIGGATRDDLPPATPAVLSARTQSFLTTLLGPMNAAWGQFVQSLDQAGQTLANGEQPPVMVGGLGRQDGLANHIQTQDQIQAAQQYLDYAQWVVPWLSACGNIVENLYTGSAYPAIIQYMNVSSNDWLNSDGSYNATPYETYAQPHVQLAASRILAVMQQPSFGSPVAYPNPAPALPADYPPIWSRAADHITGNDQGNSNLAAISSLLGVALLAGGVFFLYVLLKR